MNKSIVFFTRVVVDIDMLSSFPNQILVERPRFAFIVDIEFEKLPPFFSLCRMTGHNIFKCKQHPANLNNMAKSPTIIRYKCI